MNYAIVEKINIQHNHYIAKINQNKQAVLFNFAVYNEKYANSTYKIRPNIEIKNTRLPLSIYYLEQELNIH